MSRCGRACSRTVAPLPGEAIFSSFGSDRGEDARPGYHAGRPGGGALGDGN